MLSYTIKNLANTTGIVNNEEVVYAGKNGFITDPACVSMLCNSYTSNTTSIVMYIENLNLLVDDNSNKHILDLSDELYVTVPVVQRPSCGFSPGSVGFKCSFSNASVKILNHNVSANTITISTIDSSNPINQYFDVLPFYIDLKYSLDSTTFANNTMYIKGTTKKYIKEYNVVNEPAGTYTFTLPIATRFKKQIKVFIDDVPENNFTWSSANSSSTLSVSLIGGESKVSTEVAYYTVPAIEPRDTISLSSFSNTYSVTNVSYLGDDILYDESLTDSYLYKIKLESKIKTNVSGLKLINISEDLVGKVSNITSNSFSIEYDDSYNNTYKLANNSIYYIYQKNKLRTTSARLDEYGRLSGAVPGYYIVNSTNINRYNRSSPTISNLLPVTPIKVGKVESVNVREEIFIDTTGGASITALVSFPPILGRDITHYDILYYIESQEGSVDSSIKKLSIDHSDTPEILVASINNLPRGRAAGSNTLIVDVVPKNGMVSGFSNRVTKPLIGKTTLPNGLNSFSIGQQGTSLIFSWKFVLTIDGFILDLDTKEVEIREYSGFIDTSNELEVQNTWAISLPIERIPFPNTTFSLPIRKFGNFTYLLRVRDTSDLESETIAAATIDIKRPSSVKLFKTYNEKNPGESFSFEDGLPFPTSNTYQENSFPSFSMSINDGFVLSDSTHVDNANGSSQGFVVEGNTLSSTASVARYTTQIRDMGVVVRGTIRINSEISIFNPNSTYASQYKLIQSGFTDPNGGSSTTLVDSAFQGIGTILSTPDENGIVPKYDHYHKTITVGGNLGKIYAIRNPGISSTDAVNANAFCLIAGVVNANAIRLGASFHANGYPTGSNSFANVTISGNSYQLVDLVQYGDLQSGLTYLGEERAVVQNVFIRYANSNVYYSASSNGVVGLPGHGNTNPFAFVGAENNSAAGFRNYIAGELDFRYFQIQIELLNKKPTTSSITLENLTYEIDITETNVSKVVSVTSEDGVTVDYSHANYINNPTIVATTINSNAAYSISISNISNTNCNVKVYNSQSGLAVNTETVSLSIKGI